MENSDKIEILENRIPFWKARLKESTEAVDFLNELGDQLKISMNQEDIIRYSSILNYLENTLDELKS